jgi:hypothetical protein
MLQLAALQLVLLVIGLSCHYLFWYRLASDRVVQFFSVPVGADAQAAANQRVARAHRSFEADVIRATLVTVLAFLGLWLYIRELNTGLYGLLFSQPMRWIAGAVALYGLIWYAYFGPQRTARALIGEYRFFDRGMFREFTGPYLVTLGYQIAIVAFTAGVVGAAVLVGLYVDQQALRGHLDVLAGLPLDSAASLQVAAVKLVDFGRWLAGISQKYIVTSLFIFIYLAVEQRTALRATIHSSSIETAKVGVWAVFLISLGFSLSVLPNYYEAQHSRIFEAVVDQALQPAAAANAAEAEQLLVVQQYLDQVDIRWLLLRAVTGYGNLFAAGLLALAAAIHRFFFHGYSALAFLRIIVPAFIISRAIRLLADIGLSDSEKSRVQQPRAAMHSNRLFTPGHRRGPRPAPLRDQKIYSQQNHPRHRHRRDGPRPRIRKPLYRPGQRVQRPHGPFTRVRR